MAIHLLLRETECNLITNAFISDENVSQVLNMDTIGQMFHEEYVSDHIKEDISFWSPMKKLNNKMYMSGNKKQRVKVHDKNADLKETKNLYGRLMVLARSNWDIKQKEAIGNFEFTLTSRTFFAPSGSVLPCSDRSKFIHGLEKMTTPEDVQSEVPGVTDSPPDTVAGCHGHKIYSSG